MGGGFVGPGSGDMFGRREGPLASMTISAKLDADPTR